MSTNTPIIADLVLVNDLRFSVSLGASGGSLSGDAPAFVLDRAGRAGPSPVQALAAALAGCVAMDLVHILTRGRHAVRQMTAHLSARRADENPRRLVGVELHFVLSSDAPDDAIDRAVALSREKYCSVWHSLRQDIELQVTFARG